MRIKWILRGGIILEREDYEVLTIKYKEMRDRFIKVKKIGWAMLLILLVLAGGCASFMSSQLPYEPWVVLCRLYGIITAIMALITNMKLILSERVQFTAVDVAIYSITNIGALMLGVEIICIGIIADQAVIPALIYGMISVILCTGFWITMRRQNYKKLREGAFRGKTYIMNFPRKIWIWYLTAVPIIPFLYLGGKRRRCFESLPDLIRILFLMYAILWFWMILIYALFAQAGMFIELEFKMRKK